MDLKKIHILVNVGCTLLLLAAAVVKILILLRFAKYAVEFAAEASDVGTFLMQSPILVEEPFWV